MSDSCAIVPPPPPPPPVASCSLDVSGRDNNVKMLVFKHLLQTGKPTVNRAEINQMLFAKLQSQKEDDGCFVSHLQSVAPVLQDGPKCGLVALCMAAQTLGQEEVSIDTVFDAAQSRGYTRQGEMFSADEMAALCRIVLHCEAGVVQGEDRKQALVDAVGCGCPVLVPYDRDCNNEPCNMSGTKAHWALIAGLVLRLKKESLSSEQLNLLEQDKEMDTLYHSTSNDNLKSINPDLCSTCAYVYAYQGKSRRPNVWNLNDLLQSNAQLTALDPKIVVNLQDFVIPACGIEGGLCNKMVVLQKK